MGEKENLFRIHLLPPAQYELEEIAQLYFILAGAKSARKITDRIYRSIEKLARFLLSGSAVDDAELKALGYRYVVAGRYVSIYRVIDDSVFIYHVFDARTDYPSLLRAQLFRLEQ
jgi:plasmid stabilization system protein ParE